MDNTVKIKSWEEKPTTFLTLSVKIHKQQNEEVLDKIKALQKEIIDELKNTKVIYDPYDVKDSKGLFQYPEDRLHFSFINFLTCKCDFEKFKDSTRNDSHYEEIKKRIIQTIEKNLPKSSETEIRSLYGGKIINSLVLQAFPKEEFINKLKKIVGDIGKEIHNFVVPPCDCSIDNTVKGFPRNNPKYFPINILRFMSLGWSGSIEKIIKVDETKIINKITKFNEKYKSNPFSTFDVKKITLVESDPFLCKWENIKDFELNQNEE